MIKPAMDSPAADAASAGRPKPPRPILLAVRLMYAGAVVSVLQTPLVVAQAREPSFHAALVKSMASQHPTAAAVHAATVHVVVVGVVADLIGAALWAFMAWTNKGGRGWARIIASTLFALSTLSLLSALTQGAFGLIDLIPWLIGLAAVVLLWRRESSEYYQAARAMGIGTRAR